MFGVSFIKKPLINMGIGYVFAERVQGFHMQKYTASSLALTITGAIAGMADSIHDKKSIGAWLVKKFNKGQMAKEGEIQLPVETVAFCFFTNCVLFLGTGSYRSLFNVAVMTGLNYGAGKSIIETLNNFELI